MNVKFKSLVAAAAFIAAHAHAATVTLTAGQDAYNGVKFVGQSVWTMSADAVAAIDLFRQMSATYTPVAPALLSLVDDGNGTLVAGSMSAPVTSLSLDTSTQQIVSTRAPGGLAIEQPRTTSISTGGSALISNLEIDLANKVVYADIAGPLGVQTHQPLWNIGTVAGNALASSSPAQMTITVSGLSLTQQGLNTLVTSLGYSTLGKGVLLGVPDFGTITTTLTPTVATTCTVQFKTTSVGTRNPYLSNQVTVSNLGSSPATGWSVKWAYSTVSLVTNVKNAKIANNSGKEFTATPARTNATVAAGGSTTFSFNTSYLGSAPTIVSPTATLGGQNCAVSAP